MKCEVVQDQGGRLRKESSCVLEGERRDLLYAVPEIEKADGISGECLNHVFVVGNDRPDY